MFSMLKQEMLKFCPNINKCGQLWLLHSQNRDGCGRCRSEQLTPTTTAKGRAARSHQCSAARTNCSGDQGAGTWQVPVPSLLTLLLTQQLRPTPTASSETAVPVKRSLRGPSKTKADLHFFQLASGHNQNPEQAPF